MALLEGKRLFWCPDRETCREIIIIQTKRAELDAWCGWFNNHEFINLEITDENEFIVGQRFGVSE